jgi:hypothetical protein
VAIRYAGELGLDVQRPGFFIRERRHHGAFDIEVLSRAIRAAGLVLRCLMTVATSYEVSQSSTVHL